MATAMFIYPVKPENKDYAFIKSPRTVLEMSEDDVIRSKIFKGIYYVVDYTDAYDKLDDKALVDVLNDVGHFNITISSRKSGQGYATEDKKNFVRIIRQNYNWFNNRMR